MFIDRFNRSGLLYSAPSWGSRLTLSRTQITRADIEKTVRIYLYNLANRTAANRLNAKMLQQAREEERGGTIKVSPEILLYDQTLTSHQLEDLKLYDTYPIFKTEAAQLAKDLAGALGGNEIDYLPADDWYAPQNFIGKIGSYLRSHVAKKNSDDLKYLLANDYMTKIARRLGLV